MLLPKTATASKEDIAVLLEKKGLDPTNYQIGKTKVGPEKPLLHIRSPV